jgi:hypothetical protein
MSLIAISGYAGSGKDLVGQFIQLLNSPTEIQEATNISKLTYVDDWWLEEQSGWEIKKFAGKLKEIASILTGIPKHKFEDQEFKKTNLGPEWATWKTNDGKPSKEGDAGIGKFMTVRDFLQKLGTDGLRDGLHTNVWINALFADYNDKTHIDDEGMCLYCGADCYNGEGCDEYNSYPDKSNWILTDCRFPNEAQAVKERGGMIIRINRPGITAVNAHPSETSLDDYDFDAVIDNDGTIEDLYNKVKIVLNK